MKGLVSQSVYGRKILWHSFLITVPMIASSTIVIYIVQANLVSESRPDKALSPQPVNTISKHHYLVDFPAARLAFVSSWSATISFALLGVLMALYSYVNAASYLRISEKHENESLPGPAHTTMLLRLLNAEFTVSFELAFTALKNVFWDHERTGGAPKAPCLLTNCSAVFTLGVVASLLVQAADVYFHIAAETAQIVQYRELSQMNNQFSRGLAPWCIDKAKFGSSREEIFWGCAITLQQATYNNATTLAPTNASTISDMKNGVSDQHKAFTYMDKAGFQYAIVGPANDDINLDWKASSFGVSTTCSAIPPAACSISRPITNAQDRQSNPVMLVPFNCTQEATGLDVAGNLTSHNTITNMMNFHKYAAESAPFFDNKLVRLNVTIVANGTEDGNSIFKNNWEVLVMRKIPSAVQGDFSHLPRSFFMDPRIWKHDLLGAFALMHCKVTVWDIVYTSVTSQISILNQTQSNGSVAGISSMLGTRQVGTLANIFQDEATGPLSRSSPDNFIRSFEVGMSKAYSYALASQLSPRPSFLVQERYVKAVTSLPVTALWFLVTANLVYALLGIIITFWASLKLTEEVGQAQDKFSVASLVNALFDRKITSERVAGEKLDDALSDLEEERSTPRLGIMRTTDKSVDFVISK